MYQNRQFEEMQPLSELSFSVSFTPGAVANNTVITSSQACTLAGTTVPATFALGDQLEVFAPASAALNGLLVGASPGPTPGTAIFFFQNGTLGSITPVAAVYRIVATRLRPDTI